MKILQLVNKNNFTDIYSPHCLVKRGWPNSNDKTVIS